MKKKSLISGLTVAGLLAASTIPFAGSLALAADKQAPQKDVKQDAAQKDMKGKSGSCSGMGGCGAAMKKKKGGKAGSCTAMKK